MTQTNDKLIQHFKNIIKYDSHLQDIVGKTLTMNTKLPQSILDLEGMSSHKIRILLNNLCENIEGTYLEIGSWAGSTACSALFGNKVTSTCIDNWSEFGGPKDAFLQNIEDVKSSDINFTFIEQDFRKVDYNKIGKFNVYMFDGPHSEQDQYDGVAIAQPALDDTYILIVDDYNGHNVRAGTERAIKDLNLNVIASIDIMTRSNNGHPIISHQHSDWHNGYFIALVSKK
jgi:hypothetical protein